MEDALEADDFLEFIDLLNPVIEFHNLEKFNNFDSTKFTKISPILMPEISGGERIFFVYFLQKHPDFIFKIQNLWSRG